MNAYFIPSTKILLLLNININFLKVSFFITRPIRNFAGSIGITFKSKMAIIFNLKPSDPLQINIKIPS